jgi:dTDP-glucose 4,6-dehydratase
MDEKKILITGGAGFVGHHFVEHVLKNTNWDVLVLDSLNYAGNLSRITENESFDAKRVKFIWHDLCAPISEMTNNMLGKLDYLVHFAAESHVDKSLENSIPFIMSNVLGTANLLEYLKHNQPQCRTVIFSTDEVFGAAPQGIYYKEDDRFKPSNPYSAAKAGEEMIAFSFAHAFGMPVFITRSMNIIGERQHPEKFLPKIIRSIQSGQKVMLHGRCPNDQSSRCWIHARNVADGVMFLLDRGEGEQFYHIVGEERSVSEIANWVSQTISGKDLPPDRVEWVDYHTARPGHDKRYALSGEKMAAMGWKPPVDLEHSIKKTVEWTLKNPKWLNL